MKACNQCGMETDKLILQEVILPAYPDEIGKYPPKEMKIKLTMLWVCAECKIKFDNMYRGMTESVRSSRVDLHRIWYELKATLRI